MQLWFVNFDLRKRIKLSECLLIEIIKNKMERQFKVFWFKVVNYKQSSKYDQYSFYD